MKASQLARGYLAVKTVPLPLCRPASDTEADDHAGSAQAGPAVTVGLLPLPPGDEAIIYERAAAYARAHGLDKPAEGDELYEYGKAIHRCLVGVVDATSPPGAPEPFFDGGLEQIEQLVELGKDGVLTLAEMHQAYSDEVSGQVGDLTEEGALERALEELAGPRGAPFWFSLRPGMRVSLQLTTARLLLGFLRGKSSSGIASASNSTAKRPPAKARPRSSP